MVIGTVFYVYLAMNELAIRSWQNQSKKSKKKRSLFGGRGVPRAALDVHVLHLSVIGPNIRGSRNRRTLEKHMKAF